MTELFYGIATSASMHTQFLRNNSTQANLCPGGECLFYSDYHTKTPNPIGNAKTPTKTLRPSNPSSETPIKY